MSTRQDAPNANSTDTEEKAQQLADAMDMTVAEFDARIYKKLAESYAAEVADTDGEQAVEENRSSTIEGMYDDSIEEAAADAGSGTDDLLTAAHADADAYSPGVENPTAGEGVDENDPDNYETGVGR